MKKESFQGLICIMAGIAMATFMMAFAFRTFHLVGGEILMYKLLPFMLLVDGLSLYYYLRKFEIVKELSAKGQKFVAILLCILAISMLVFGTGLFFFGMHYEGGAIMLMTGSVSFAVASVWAGCVGAKLLKNKA